MKIISILGLFIFTIVCWSDIQQKPENIPKYIDIDLHLDIISSTKAAFYFSNPDSLITHQMNLLRDTNDIAICYHSDIQTPVCIDGICKPVRIEMYWNLLGNYIGYGVYPDQLLTKYDHDLFDEKDYLKLHQLLKDRHSILDRKDMSSLYDLDQARKDTITFNGIEVDGVTGATKMEIKKSIVEGALYSCFKLWHIANGEAAKKASAYTSEIYNDQLEDAFLTSNFSDYQFFALQQMDSVKMNHKIGQIIPLIAKGDPLLRSYILKKIPDMVYKQSSFARDLYVDISDLDVNSKTILIDKLRRSDILASTLLSGQLEFLTKNQLKSFFEFLSENTEAIEEETLKNINHFGENKDFPYSYLAVAFMKAH